MTLGDSLCSGWKYACCEPRAGDYDSGSDDGRGIEKAGGAGRRESYRNRQEQQHNQHYQRQPPKLVASSETSQTAAKYDEQREVNNTNGEEHYYREHERLSLNKLRASRPPSHQAFSDEARSRNEDFSDGGWVGSPYTDATRMASPAIERSRIANEEKVRKPLLKD